MSPGGRLVDLRVALRGQEDPLVGRQRGPPRARAIDDARPTTKGAIIRGKTTMSRSGTSGSVRVAGRSGRGRGRTSFGSTSLDAGASGPARRAPGPGDAGEKAVNRPSGATGSARRAAGRRPCVMTHSSISSSEGTRYITSSMSSSRMILRPRAPSVALHRLLGDLLDGVVGEPEPDVLELEERLVLLDRGSSSAPSGCETRAALVEVVERRDDRDAADELRDHPELDQVLGVDLLEDVAGALLASSTRSSRRSPSPSRSGGGR